MKFLYLKTSEPTGTWTWITVLSSITFISGVRYIVGEKTSGFEILEIKFLTISSADCLLTPTTVQSSRTPRKNLRRINSKMNKQSDKNLPQSRCLRVWTQQQCFLWFSVFQKYLFRSFFHLVHTIILRKSIVPVTLLLYHKTLTYSIIFKNRFYVQAFFEG